MSPSDLQLASRPTLLNSCSMAATAAEARFRITNPKITTATSRVIALDHGATPLVFELARYSWHGARFLSFRAPLNANGHEIPDDAALLAHDGEESRLSTELVSADLIIMIASNDDGADGAAVIGEACASRGVMTTGIVFAEWGDLDRVVSSLRPNAMVIVVSKDEDDLRGILTALRA